MSMFNNTHTRNDKHISLFIFTFLFICFELFFLHAGTFQEFSVEQEVIDHAFNDTSYFDEVVVKRFIISENITLLHQGKILLISKVSK